MPLLHEVADAREERRPEAVDRAEVVAPPPARQMEEDLLVHYAFASPGQIVNRSNSASSPRRIWSGA